MKTKIHDVLNEMTLPLLCFHSEPDQIRRPEVAEAARGLVRSLGRIEYYEDCKPFMARFEALQRQMPELYAHRTATFWKYLQAGFQIVTLKMSAQHFARANSLKFRLSLLSVLLDDLCDLARDEALFRRAVRALQGELLDGGSELDQLVRDLWASIQADLDRAPNHPLLRGEMDKAFIKWLNSFEYGMGLAATPSHSIRWRVHLDVIPHTTNVYYAGLIDLLFVEELPRGRIRDLKRIFLRTQKMAQIGNWVTTWERELGQNDFTSGMLAYAVENGWLEPEEIGSDGAELRRKLQDSPAQSQLMRLWQRLRLDSHRLADGLPGGLADGYVDAFSVVLFIQLARVY